MDPDASRECVFVLAIDGTLGIAKAKIAFHSSTGPVSMFILSIVRTAIQIGLAVALASTPLVALAQERPRDRIVEEQARSERSGRNRERDFQPALPSRRRAVETEEQDSGPEPGEQADNTIQGNAAVKLVSQVILFQFEGTQAADGGVRAVRSLLQAGAIAGVWVGRENIVSKAQIKTLLRGFGDAKKDLRPILATGETGGTASAFSFEKGFDGWPSQKDISAKGDPQFAYSAYQTLASTLQRLGFNMNFGPWIGQPGTTATYGANSLQAAVFAKTFILGHNEVGVTPVPFLDGSDTAFKTLKVLLVSNPNMPLAFFASAKQNDAQLPFQDIRAGVRFCVYPRTGGGKAEDVAKSFAQGCDAAVLPAADENAALYRQRVIRSIANAIANGTLSAARFGASAKRMDDLRRGLSAVRVEDAPVLDTPAPD